MGEICIDCACADCGDFFESHTCNTEEELKLWYKEHGEEVHYCTNCRTFTKLTSGKKVKVIFPSYGTAIGWFEFFMNLDQYIRESELGYKFTKIKK